MNAVHFSRSLRRAAFLERLHAYHVEQCSKDAAKALGLSSSNRDGVKELIKDQICSLLKKREGMKLAEPRESSIHGTGVFASTNLKKGTIVGLYPGVVYPRNSSTRPEKHGHLYFALDGQLFDPMAEYVNKDSPLALGHWINHPPKPEQLNAMFCNVNLDGIPTEIERFVPNVHYETRKPCLQTVAVMVQKDIAKDDELFVDYNMDFDGNEDKLPPWYTPVPKPGIPTSNDFLNHIYGIFHVFTRSRSSTF